MIDDEPSTTVHGREVRCAPGTADVLRCEFPSLTDEQIARAIRFAETAPKPTQHQREVVAAFFAATDTGHR